MWNATLRSLGIVPIRVADKAAGRIETDVYVFVFPVGKAVPFAHTTRLAGLGADNLTLAQVGGGGNLPTQAIWATLSIQVRSLAPRATAVDIQTHINHALHYGLYPGGSDIAPGPWADVFSRIRAQLPPTQ